MTSAPSRDAVEMLSRLVGFATVSTRSNMELIDYVRDYLAKHGVQAVVIADPTQPKANLFATIGPSIAGGVALSGHTDVVPTEGQQWSADPFTLVAREDKLYGRGSADMKGFIAVALSLVPELTRRTLKRPIHLCFSYDEELGCFGAPRMIERMGRDLPAPDLVVIGEPTGMQVANAHKGIRVQATEIIGREGHSSMPDRGLNAITVMGRFIGLLERLAEELKAAGERDAIPGLGFDPPYTSLNLGKIGGGTALNIIARECRLEWEFRPLPGADPEGILARLEAMVDQEIRPLLAAHAPQAQITTTPVCTVSAFRPEPNGVAEALALSLTGHNHAVTVSFGSEAGQFQDAGFSTIMCGPGSVKQAHLPDEFVSLEQLGLCERFLRRLADWAAA